MKYIVDNKHREFFAEKGWIEFEQLMSQEKVIELRRLIGEVMSQRFRLKKENVERLPSQEILLKGHDIWRDSPLAKAIICHRVFAEIASELTEVKPLRLAYDQALIVGRGLPQEFGQVASIQEISSIQGLVCGVLIALQSNEGEEPLEGSLPHKEGHGVFFTPTAPINFPELFKKQGDTYLLIVYCKVISRYAINGNDPLSHLMKGFGYSAGDKLVDQYHPVLFR